MGFFGSHSARKHLNNEWMGLVFSSMTNTTRRAKEQSAKYCYSKACLLLQNATPRALGSLRLLLVDKEWFPNANQVWKQEARMSSIGKKIVCIIIKALLFFSLLVSSFLLQGSWHSQWQGSGPCWVQSLQSHFFLTEQCSCILHLPHNLHLLIKIRALWAYQPHYCVWELIHHPVEHSYCMQSWSSMILAL